jgi:uncharacterized protein
MKKNNINIDKKWLEILFEIFEDTKGLDKVILYGSRARGDHKPKSDIDLAIDVDSYEIGSHLYSVIEESNILLSVDVVVLKYVESKKFLDNVKNQGIVIWERKK